MVFLGGIIVVVQMGDLNVLILMFQLVYLWFMWGVYGCLVENFVVIFIFGVVYSMDIGESFGLVKEIVFVQNICNIGKKDFKFNDVMFEVEVYFEIYEVCVDGEFLIC